MTLDKAEVIAKILTDVLSVKSPIIHYRMSVLKGFSFNEITTALKLRLAREFWLCKNDSLSLMEFQRRVDSYSEVALFMPSHFVSDSTIDAFYKLCNDSNDFNSAMDWLHDEWLKEKNQAYKDLDDKEDIASFANYCKSVGAKNPLYWQKIYTRLSLEYRPNFIKS